MVPCQPRQLVILSLPFAALVAFFWYKRRKSSSHSDPGGTAALKKPVDKTVAESSNTEPELDVQIERKVEKDCLWKGFEESLDAALKAEEVIIKTNNAVVLSTPKPNGEAKEILPVTVEKNLTPVKEATICNGAAIHIIDEPEVVGVHCKEVVNTPATPHFETSQVFNSTTIEDEKTREESELKEPVEELVTVDELIQSVDVKNLESSFSIDQSAPKKDKDNKVECESEIFAENESSDDSDELEEASIKSIPFEEQSTIENIAIKDKAVKEELPESLSESSSPLAEALVEVEADFKKKNRSSSSCGSTERLEDVSADTGLGSQDLSNAEDSTLSANMAQGQKTEEKTQNNSSGLEQKLASLGLDTQPPTQRVERDSANHSPAEVMLNSPAISTFSDAHSEGSSDSGKGCSDVVTPPSRTPAGGSSVAGDQVPIVYEFVLPQVIVGRLIGRHGAFLQDIRAKTHTNVFIKRHPETNSLKICAIEGTQPDIDAALKMIRQKFPLRRFPELTLERVTFVKNSCLPINPENLQLHLVDGVNNDVLLSSLITAGHFFLQLPMHMSYQSLYRLACIMNSVYSTQESPPLPDPMPDVVCVAPAHGGWYRAQILSVDEENNTSDIRFLDYGGFLTVDNTLLRQIRGDFLLLPFQAVECALANVIPAGGEEEWSEEAKQFVQLMTTHQTLQAQVYEYTESGLPLVYLYCTQFCQSPSDPSGVEMKVVLLNQELVSRGFAELIDTTQEDSATVAPESS